MKKAFTFLEVIVVVLIVGFVSFFAFERYTNYFGQIKIRNVQTEIASDISLYKAYGYNQQRDVVFNFFARYYEVYIGDKLVKTIILDDNFSCSSRKLGFKSDGVTKYAGSVVLYYKGEQVSKFILAPVTGLFRWESL